MTHTRRDEERRSRTLPIFESLPHFKFEKYISKYNISTMGSCFSQEAQVNQNVVIPKVTWEVDETWANESETFRQMAVEGGVDASTAFQSSMFKRATEWLNRFVTHSLSFVVKHKNRQLSEFI